MGWAGPGRAGPEGAHFKYIKLTCGKACLGGRAITDSVPLYVSADGSVLNVKFVTTYCFHASSLIFYLYLF